MIRALRQDQESLKHSVEEKIKAYCTSIERKLDSLKDEVYLEVEKLATKIEKVEERLEALEARGEEDYPVDSSVVIINLKEDGQENITNKCEQIIKDGPRAQRYCTSQMYKAGFEI